MTLAALLALRLKGTPAVLAHFPTDDPKAPPKSRIVEGWRRGPVLLPQIRCMGIGRERPVGYDPLGPAAGRVQVTISAQTMSACSAILPDVIRALEGSWSVAGHVVHAACEGPDPAYEEEGCSLHVDFLASRYS